MDDYADDIAALLVRVYEIHEAVILESGGILGLRDRTMLHAAVARPFTTFDGAELYVTEFDKASALMHSLIKSHPFFDGTKRTAFASALYFLSAYNHIQSLSLYLLSMWFNFALKLQPKMCESRLAKILNGEVLPTLLTG